MYTQAVAETPQGANTARLWGVGARIEWRDGNKAKAIELGNLALKECREARLKSQLIIELAYYNILSGNLEPGEKLNKQVEPNLYTELNDYALSRCRGQEDLALRDKLQKEVDKGNRYLAVLMQEVLTACD